MGGGGGSTYIRENTVVDLQMLRRLLDANAGILQYRL